MKKICFISGVISRSGGTERVGSIIANSLSDLGYDVTILSFWNSGEPYFGLDKTIKVDYMLNPKTEGKLYRTYLYPVWKLHKYICKNEFDIVIDIDTLLSLYTTRAIKGTKCKLISWEHFNYWTMEMLKEKKRFKAKKLIKKYAKRLVVLTEEDRQKHIDEYSL
ncbi:TPA: glycosyltransferase, partial [Enterococcus faecium]